MKKVGYILTILLALWVFSSVLRSIQANTNLGAPGRSIDYTTVSIILLFVVCAIAGAIGGFLKKSWGKKVSIGVVGIFLATQVLTGQFMVVLIGAVVLGVLFFAE